MTLTLYIILSPTKQIIILPSFFIVLPIIFLNQIITYIPREVYWYNIKETRS